MARRQCDDCGANMGAYEPRTRVGDKMLCDACKDGSRGGMVSRTAAWSQQRHPDPIVHTPGRRPPRPLMTGDTLLWESGHSEPIISHSESLLWTPAGIKHRRPIEGDDSQTIFAQEPDDVSRINDAVGASPEQEEFLRSNPIGPSKYSSVDHDVLYHLTDKHRFALDPDYAPQDNAFAIEDRSGRKGLYGVGDRWDVNSWRHGQGYQRPYVAEVHVPKGLAQDGRWGREKFLPAEHYDQATVHRVIPVAQHDAETYEGAKPGGKDVRDFTPEEHTKHLLNLRNELHDVHGWGWNEFNDKHEHVGTDEYDDQGMDIRRDRDGNVMTRGRYAKRKGLPKTQKCEYCDDRATKRLLWAEGMAYIPTCDAHEGKARHRIEVTNKDEVASVKSIPKAAVLTKEGHDSGDGMTVFHCPFCGSGQVLARSDRTIECQFCHTAFTVQVQPVYPNFPQTIDGQPMQVPGMPGQVDPMGGGMPPGAGAPPSGDEEPGDSPFGSDDLDDSGVPPTDEADAEADDDSGSGDSSGHEKETGNPFAKKTYRTAKGHLLSEADYLRHIAITTSPDPLLTAAQIKMARLSDCTTCGGSGYATKDPSGQRTFTCPCCHGAGAHEPGDECSSLEDLDYDGGR